MVRAPRSARERGASLVEYALLVALIAVVCIAAVTQFGDNTSDAHQDAADSISDGVSGCGPPGSHRGTGDASHEGVYEDEAYCYMAPVSGVGQHQQVGSYLPPGG